MGGEGAFPPFLTFDVLREEEGLPISSILRVRFSVSRKLIRRLKKPGCVLVNGKPSLIRRRAAAGDRIELRLPAGVESAVIPEPLPLAIAYEDRDILVVDKPAGILVHPAGPVLGGTLANGVAHHLRSRGEPSAAGPVTRLDRETSGLVLFAKHPYAHDRLSEALERGELDRRYLALLEGHLDVDEGRIDEPIERVSGRLTERRVSPTGRPAVTCFRVLERFPAKEALPPTSLVEFELSTGRTHQIRVHASHLGHPVVGDPLYGRVFPGLIERQALHAHRLSLVHPASGERRAFSSDPPADMGRLLARVGREAHPDG